MKASLPWTRARRWIIDYRPLFRIDIFGLQIVIIWIPGGSFRIIGFVLVLYESNLMEKNIGALIVSRYQGEHRFGNRREIDTKIYGVRSRWELIFKSFLFYSTLFFPTVSKHAKILSVRVLEARFDDSIPRNYLYRRNKRVADVYIVDFYHCLLWRLLLRRP